MLGAKCRTGRAARASASACIEFNRDWSRRVLGQGAIVLLFTDGLEREGIGELVARDGAAAQVRRRLVWLNPLLRFDGFEPRAQGVRAMLPHVDEFRPVHNLASVAALVEALSARTRRRGRRSARVAEARPA